MDSFRTDVFERAEREFRQFVATYPNSPLLPEAILLQARSALQQTNLSAAIALLSANVAKAGQLADQYRYRLATAYHSSSNYAAAAASFLFITTQYTNSPLLLEASYGEALARFKLGDPRRVIRLLGDRGGAYQLATRARPTDVSTLRGRLLLAEALLKESDYAGAEDVVAQLPEAALTPEFLWDRAYLQCRIRLAARRLDDALETTTNLVRTAALTSSRTLAADALAMQADILQQLNRLPEALQVYTNNLADTVPTDRRRLAFLNIVEIKLAQGQPAEAAQMLEAFLTRQPEDASSDFLLLISGELHLKLHRQQAGVTNLFDEAGGPPPAVTNHLHAALAQFDQLLVAYTNSPLRGKAWLNRGWCLWLEDKITESASAFRGAVEALPFSEDLAVARFKLADTLYRQGDPTNALIAYRALTNDFASLPRVRETLLPQALYQIVRTSIDTGDARGAAGTAAGMVSLMPASELTERALWLVGWDRLLRLRQPREARATFEELLERFPSRPLRPEVELALARTQEVEGDWPGALHSYEEWLSRHSETNTLRARAEYSRAFATDRAGDGTNAFQLFTRFLSQFPADELAQRAQMWIASRFYRDGNYREALRQFQMVPENTNWPVNRLTYEARMMAGRAAHSAQLWKDAAGKDGHFTLLLNDLNCPYDDLVAEALYAYGDTTIEDNTEPNPLLRYSEALKAFARIPQRYPNNRLVPLAWGRVGDCCLQLASQDPKQLAEATNAYLTVMTKLPAADLNARSLAEFGLAAALRTQADGKAPAEATAILKVVLDHLLNIVFGKNLREGEQPDPVWVEKAGLAAGRLAEELKQARIAANIYERLSNTLPPLRPRLQERLNKLQDVLRNEKEQRGE